MANQAAEKEGTEAQGQAPALGGLSPLAGILGRSIERRLRAIKALLEEGVLFESEDTRNAVLILIDSAIKLARCLQAEVVSAKLSVGEA